MRLHPPVLFAAACKAASVLDEARGQGSLAAPDLFSAACAAALALSEVLEPDGLTAPDFFSAACLAPVAVLDQAVCAVRRPRRLGASDGFASEGTQRLWTQMLAYRIKAEKARIARDMPCREERPLLEPKMAPMESLRTRTCLLKTLMFGASSRPTTTKERISSTVIGSARNQGIDTCVRQREKRMSLSIFGSFLPKSMLSITSMPTPKEPQSLLALR